MSPSRSRTSCRRLGLTQASPCAQGCMRFCSASAPSCTERFTFNLRVTTHEYSHVAAAGLSRRAASIRHDGHPPPPQPPPPPHPPRPSPPPPPCPPPPPPPHP